MNLHRLEDHVRIRAYVLTLLLTRTTVRDLKVIGARHQRHTDCSVTARVAEGLPTPAIVLHKGSADPIPLAIEQLHSDSCCRGWGDSHLE